MIPFKCGEVVLLPFPFTDLTTTKQRPAIIISSDWYNQNRNDLIVVAITSQIPLILKEEDLFLSESEQQVAGLPKKSIVKVTKLVTINQTLVRKKIGKVPKRTMKNVKKQLNKFLG